MSVTKGGFQTPPIPVADITCEQPLIFDLNDQMFRFCKNFYASNVCKCLESVLTCLSVKTSLLCPWPLTALCTVALFTSDPCHLRENTKSEISPIQGLRWCFLQHSWLVTFVFSIFPAHVVMTHVLLSPSKYRADIDDKLTGWS